jgi:CheY-like chemotaxis protein
MAKILVVDDEPLARNSVAIFLELQGHEVQQAADGIEALDLFAAHHFAVVVSDMRMPRMDGLRLIEQIRMLKPALPIIVVTGYADTVPDGIPILSKPLKLQDLADQIADLIGANSIVRRSRL